MQGPSCLLHQPSHWQMGYSARTMARIALWSAPSPRAADDPGLHPAAYMQSLHLEVPDTAGLLEQEMQSLGGKAHQQHEDQTTYEREEP